MDRTRKALDKARRQRESVRAGDHARTPSRPANAASGAAPRTRAVKTTPEILRDNRIVAGLPNEAAADIFRMLRTKVMLSLASQGHSTLAVCSALPGEGKTLVAVNLAVGLAMDVNYTVLLVDLDFRNPGVHGYFGIEPEFGLTDYLLGEASLADCLINPGYERLVLLPSGAPLDHSSEILSSPRMAELAQELRDRYPDRIMIYDVAPLLVADDYLAFMHHVDACLMVVAEGATKVADIERAMDLLKDSNVIGTVLNKSSQRNLHTYYYKS